MDNSHKLDAPDNDSLSRIDQVGDHSNLSTLYRKAKNDWTGELVSDVERERRRQNKYDTISFGIRKKFIAVALLTTLPIIVAIITMSAALVFVTEQNAGMLVIPAIFLILFWIIGSYFAYKKLYTLFYANALQAGPFIITLLVLLGLSIPIIHILTAGIHNQHGLYATSIIGGVELLIATVLTFPLLILWTTPKLSGNARVGIIAAIALVLLAINALLLFA